MQTLRDERRRKHLILLNSLPPAHQKKGVSSTGILIFVAVAIWMMAVLLSRI